MSNSIFITGVAGSGKSTVCQYLLDQGYNAIDLEEVPGLFASINQVTGQPASIVDHDDLENVKQHDWICDKDKLRELIDANRQLISYYFVSASNTEEIIPLFDQVILIKVDEQTMRYRLSHRKTNQFGRATQVQDWICTWKDWWENEIIKLGAKMVDGNRSVEEVAKEILRIAEEKTSGVTLC